MDIRIIKGNRNFMLPKDNAEIAITEEAAKKWFRTEDPIGKEVKMLRHTKKICAIVRAENRHTNFPFDFIGNPELGKTWWYITWNILIKVKPDTDIEELESKINANLPAELKQVTSTRKTGIERIILTPLSKLHYAKDFRNNKEAGITFQYIIYFSIAGILIITCALINYLTLFINRMRVRQREMALRMIHGANIRSLVSLLTVEFLLLLACAVTTGFLLIEICFSSFIELTGIDAAKSSLYGETFLFIGLISLIILTAIIGLLYILYHRSLHLSLHYNTGRRTGTQLRRGSIVLQLLVCLSFIGCTVLINQQLDYLRHRDLGLEIKNRGSFSVMGDMDYTPLIKKIKENDITWAHGNPTFFFVAEGTDLSGAAHRYEDYVTFVPDNYETDGNGYATVSVTLRNIPLGQYTIWEKPVLRYYLKDVWADTENVRITKKAEAAYGKDPKETAVGTAALTVEKPDAALTFLNEKARYDKFSHTDCIKNTIPLLFS